MRSICSFFFSLTALITLAQAPANYYNSAQGLTGTALRQALHNIIDNHAVQAYSSLYTHYNSTDILKGDTIWDMYSLKANGTANYYFKNIASRRCGNYSVEGDCFNREHSWPQSWFNSASPMQSDLFHVYPTDGKVNGIRSNYPYGKVNVAPTITTNGSKLGPCVSPGYAGTVFEPIDNYKGDLARTYFYMSTRYYTEDALWSSSGSVTKCELKPWTAALMLQWHHFDTVSTKEINRNNAVYAIQGNRNPFIDHPEWADSIFSALVPSDLSLLEKIKEPMLQVFPNPTQNSKIHLYLSKLNDQPISVAITDMSGKIVYQSLYTDFTSEAEIDAEKLAQGVYLLTAKKNTEELQIKLVLTHQ
jgi:endonuclease I